MDDAGHARHFSGLGRTLLRVDNADARDFYQIEAVEDCWAPRELERQINSLLYERLALSKDKKGLSPANHVAANCLSQPTFPLPLTRRRDGVKIIEMHLA